MNEAKGFAWAKFHPVFGPDLKVALESTFPRDFGPKYNFDVRSVSQSFDVPFPPLVRLIEQLVHANPSETIRRVYHPAVTETTEKRTGVTFVPWILPEGEAFKRLVFRRKERDRKYRFSMFCARFDEHFAFGFSSINSTNQGYVSLAYPGKNPEFKPVFVKIWERGKETAPTYLKIEAKDSEEYGGSVKVTAEICEDTASPLHLVTEW